MIQVTPQMRVLVAVEPVDFRRGIDGLARLVQSTLRDDPRGGRVFVFRNRSGTAVKILVYDGRGYWMCHKRLSAGKFGFWPDARGGRASAQLEAHELSVLLAGGDFQATRGAPQWHPVASNG